MGFFDKIFKIGLADNPINRPSRMTRSGSKRKLQKRDRVRNKRR